jgi:hypothetical protein
VYLGVEVVLRLSISLIPEEERGLT